ncbi:hypothetical protein CM49_03366 [Paenibacillus sp. P1XP2]|nr:hypothetical protein CM49_03366 [Paenibacillus sp. P1XP2]
MDRTTWLKKASTLKLTESLHLCRADAPEWERYVHVYYHQATIAFRCREKENFLSGGDEPFWLVKDQTVVGGLALSPWAFRYFFTVPPFEGGAEVIRLIAQTLRRQGGNGCRFRQWRSRTATPTTIFGPAFGRTHADSGGCSVRRPCSKASIPR